MLRVFFTSLSENNKSPASQTGDGANCFYAIFSKLLSRFEIIQISRGAGERPEAAGLPEQALPEKPERGSDSL